ncbi:hypothetical protein SAMN05216418_1469 [Microbacterium enclense]|uniref:Uncharacterized protein n=1 Tax=Microbacterium enclense TaxID=993073 RepID=A0A1G6IC86_9MICO|nr:hypothetical protein AS029_06060 [Microbacterium enclense]SDC04157.1 hypothetical protein SAMN05216418_1469 [Microbacterium enclense]
MTARAQALAVVLDSAIEAEAAARALAPVNHHELRMCQLGRPGPDGSARRFSEAQRARWDARDALEDQLASDHLEGVSDVVSETFRDALSSRRYDDARHRARDFAAFAAVLTRAGEVAALVGALEPRPAAH